MLTHFLLIFLCSFEYCFGDCSKVLNDVMTAVSKLEDEVRVLKAREAEQKQRLKAQAQLIEHLEHKIRALLIPKHHAKGLGLASKRFLLADDGLVAFTAKINPHTVERIASHDPIIFETIDLNAGAGYNPTTGHFVAPKSGVYLFSLSLLAHNLNSYAVHGEIVHNHVPVARALAVGEYQGHRDQGAVTVLVNLLHSDEVWVRNVDFQNVTVGGDLFSVFSGYLLWPRE